MLDDAEARAQKITYDAEVRAQKIAHAQSYVDAGYYCIPCDKGTKQANGKWLQKQYDPNQDVALLPSIYGVRLGYTDLVLDVDPRRYGGRNQLSEFQQLLDLDLERTYSVATGHKDTGWHFYFKKPADFKVRRTLKEPFRAIEIKSYGQYVIGPGSRHPSGNLYEVVNGGVLADIKDAPENLLAYLHYVPGGSESTVDIEDDSEANQEWVKKDLYSTSIYESAYALACRVRESGVSEEVCYELLREHWNPRCQPPRDDDVLRGKVRNAYQYAQNPLGSGHLRHVFPSPLPSEIVDGIGQQPAPLSAEDALEASLHWQRNDRKEYKSTLYNLTNFFQVIPQLTGLVRLNVFSQKIEFQKRAPWHRKLDDGKLWTDRDTVALKLMLSRREFQARTDLFHEGILLQATEHQYHPVRDYLRSITWDGVKRIDHLFSIYAGAEDNEYVREVGKNMMIGAVARVEKPGCQLDTMVILEGLQGTQKTTFVRVLGGEFYGDIKISSHKDCIDAMRGKWIIEQSELKFRKFEDVEAVKSFLSIVEDTVRPAYARFSIDVPRSSIFIGTINPGKCGSYLTDQTGNRRFWPIATGRINIEKLIEDRDQLWAEAFERYQEGEPYHITKSEIHMQAEKEQEKRREVDPWDDVIAHWLSEAELPAVLTTEHIAARALGMTNDKLNTAVAKRIGTSVRNAGLTPFRKYENGQQRRCWIRESDLFEPKESDEPVDTKDQTA